MTTIEKELIALANEFIQSMEDCNEDRFTEIWHPQAIRFGLGNSNELMTMTREEVIKFSINGLKNLKKQIPNPEVIKFEIEEIIQTKAIQEVLGIVELKWKMQLPGSIGTHHTIMTFAKDNEKWLIVNYLDKGFEQTD